MTPFNATAAADSVAHRHEALDPAVFAIVLGVVVIVSAILTYRAVLALSASGVDDRGKVSSWALLKTFPSTSGRIIVELALAVIYVMGCMVADMIGRPVGEQTQDTLGLFIAAMLGIGAGQFFGKRKTDADYVAAKNSGPATTVVADTVKTGGPTTVVDGAAPPAAEGSGT